MSPRVAPRRRLGGEGGTTLVEFAIVAPLLFGILLAIVDFGFAFNAFISVRQGSREATRQAVTGRVGTDEGCTVVAATQPNASVKRVVCMAKNRSDLHPDDVRVRLNVEGAYQDRRSLQVCTMARLHSASGLYGPVLDGRVVQSSVQMRIEQTTDEAAGTSVAPLVSFSEDPFPGQTWNCTLSATS